MTAIRPMLASDFPGASRLKFPFWAQPKYDGVRALVVNGAFQARSGKPFANPHVHLLAEILPHGLDGELIIFPGYGPHTCAPTSGIVNSKGHPIDNLIYIVYDLWDSRASYEQRLAQIDSLAPKLPAYCHITENIKIENARQLESFEEKCLAKGYEGLILRNHRAAYKYGRCTENDFRLAKFKRFETSEAKCVGIEEQMENVNPLERSPLGYVDRSSAKNGKIGKGILGAFLCEWRDPKDGSIRPIRLGTGEGLTQAMRAAYYANPPIGEMLTFKYQSHGVKDKPRSGIFITVRKDL